MKRLIFATGLLVLFAATGGANAADSWGLEGEKIARFEAKVVDIACELTGNCPANCGAGNRQLGLLTDVGRLVLPTKNQVPFAGAAWELVDFCQKRVVVDGLFVNNRGHEIFALQFVKAVDGKWQRANRFTGKWLKEAGLPEGSPKADQWFRNDPQVNALIKADGKLGLGLKADQDYQKFLDE